MRSVGGFWRKWRKEGIGWADELQDCLRSLGWILPLLLLFSFFPICSTQAGIGHPQALRGWEGRAGGATRVVDERGDQGSIWPELTVDGQVRSQLRKLTGSGRESLLKAFRNAEVYLEEVKRLFEQAGLPPELSYLAVLESAFDPFARSRSGAVGIWQFMESTARLFGLEINWWVDERRDPEKASLAAARYLRRLRRQFDSWPLAVAAYNAGEARVMKAIRARPTADIWTLPLPRETRLLLSAFVALTKILEEPAACAFPSLLEGSPAYAKVVVEACTDVTVIARACDTSPEEILNLNPELKQGCTPPDRELYELRIPLRALERFEEALSQIPPQERVIWARHRVRKGDSLSGVARRYGVPARIIAQLNELHPPYVLKAGMELCLPIPQEFRRWAKGRSPLGPRYPLLRPI
jgi:membrane-bound lytic murein transglycosylase D